MRRHVRCGIVVLGVFGVALGGMSVASARPLPQPPGHTLTVTEAGTGGGSVTSGDGAISCPSVCSNFYTSAAPVTLTATAAAGSTFAGWGGDCSGTTPTCQLTMNSNRAVSATFTRTSSGPPPAPPSCTGHLASRHVLLRATKSHPAKLKKVGKLFFSFGCNQPVKVTLTVKVTEFVPGRHHHKVSFRLVRHYALAAHHTDSVAVKLWAGALHGLKRHYRETLAVSLSAANHNGGNAWGATGPLTGVG